MKTVTRYQDSRGQLHVTKVEAEIAETSYKRSKNVDDILDMIFLMPIPYPTDTTQLKLVIETMLKEGWEIKHPSIKTIRASSSK